MRYCRFLYADAVAWGRIENTNIHRLSAAPYLGGTPDGWSCPVDRARLVAPAAPSKVVCIGRNYRDHAAELNNPVPTEPLLFLKAPSALIGPEANILLPTREHRIDFEAELVAVVGRRVRDIAVDAALGAIFGYTCGNDISDRVLQKRDGQFTRAKSFDTYCPLGPWIETDLDPRHAQVECWVNGERRQAGETPDMIFDLPHLVAFIADVMTLEPGDLIMTGTPAGVGPLTPGDRVEVRIPGIGSLANAVALRGGA